MRLCTAILGKIQNVKSALFTVGSATHFYGNLHLRFAGNIFTQQSLRIPNLDTNQRFNKKYLNDQRTAMEGFSAEGESLKLINENSLGFLEEIFHLVVQDVLVDSFKRDAKVVDYRSPEELTEALDLEIKDHGTEWKELLKECKKVIKYSIKTSHPRHLNLLFANPDLASLAGTWITDALNTSQTVYETAPVFIVVEKYMISVLNKLVGFADGDGVFVPGSSFGNFMAVHLARYRYNNDIKQCGMFGLQRLFIFCSAEAHYSTTKAANFLGFGTDSVVSVKTEDGRMLPGELEKALLSCQQSGHIPLIVVATCGTTVLGGFDPLLDLLDVCKKYKVWIHVDAAWGGSVLFSKHHRHLMAGIERCDSMVWSLHKQLGAHNQCAVFLLKEKELLLKCNSSQASYLFAQDKFYDTSYDIGDKTVQCGRKIDAFKLWMMWKSRGYEGMTKHVEDAFDNARYVTEKIKLRQGFRLVQTKVQYINVCFWYIPLRLRGLTETDGWWQELNKIAPKIKEEMTKRGNMLISYQPLESQGFVNFFRIIAHTQCNKSNMDFILDEIDTIGCNL